MKLTFLSLLLVGLAGVFVSGEDIRPQPPITTPSNSTTADPFTVTPSTTTTTTTPPPSTSSQAPNTTTSAPPTSSPNTTTSAPPTSPNTTTSAPPTSSPNTTTSAPPTSSPNTTTSAPPTSSPNTTTSAPPTSSPNTTTSAPPTSSPNTTTSAPPTASPNTTTSAPPSSTPIPPAPKTGNWMVKDKNVTCIVADMALQLNITLGKENKSVVVDVPETANVTGSCGNATQTLILIWGRPNITAKIEIVFEKNVTAKVFSMSEVNVTLPFGFVPDANASLTFFEKKEDFSTPLSKSYKCAKVQELKLSHLDNSTTAVLKISHVQFEAFREKQDGNFGSAEDCESSNPSTDVVPIAVGCVLVGLVIIVLIAYLVGRRRSQSRGYLSM